jgi:hypothetical protein
MYNLLAVNPRTFVVEDTNSDGNMEDVEVNVDGFSTEFRTTTGPSFFRYTEMWDARNNEFKVIANYLDDIAPYLTTRSYTYRAFGIGGVSISGGSMTAPVNTDQIARDRMIEQVIDVGKMRTQRRDPSAVNVTAGNRNAYEVVYSDQNAQKGP